MSDEKRAGIYLVTTLNYSAGRYVGETETHVVLAVGDQVRGFPWGDVEPVTMRATESGWTSSSPT